MAMHLRNAPTERKESNQSRPTPRHPDTADTSQTMPWTQLGPMAPMLSALFARQAGPSRVVGRTAASATATPRHALRVLRIQQLRTGCRRASSTNIRAPKQGKPKAKAKAATKTKPEAEAENNHATDAPSPANRSPLRALGYIIPLIPIGLVLWEITGIELIWVTGRSMAPYLNAEYEVTNLRRDVMLARRVSGYTELERGMVVVFRSPRDPSYISTKRIIGLAGDRVTPRPDAVSPSDQTPVIVPWNHLWVEGDADDSRETLDSNTYGPISRNLVEGRAVWLLRPTMKALRWEDWEGEGDERQGSGWKQRRRVEKGAVAVQEPMTFS